MSILEYNITRLGWIEGKEEDRHKLKNRVIEEAEERGNKILEDILGLFPNLETIRSIPEMQVNNKITGSFEFKLRLNIYRSKGSMIIAELYNYAPNTHCSNITDDLHLLISQIKTKKDCRNYQNKINKILESYKKEDQLDEQHKYESKLF